MNKQCPPEFKADAVATALQTWVPQRQIAEDVEVSSDEQASRQGPP